MPISTAIIDKKIARLKTKLAGLNEIQAEIDRLEGVRERVAELEGMFPTRTRGPRKTTTTKKTATKKTTKKTAKKGAAKKRKGDEDIPF